MGVSIFHNLDIPVMVVFTKYHILFNEHYRDCLRDNLPQTGLRVEDANRASRAFIKFTKVIEFPFVPRPSINAEDRQKRREDESLSRTLIMDVLAAYKPTFSHIHEQVKEVANTFKVEEKIASVIRDAL